MAHRGVFRRADGACRCRGRRTLSRMLRERGRNKADRGGGRQYNGAEHQAVSVEAESTASSSIGRTFTTFIMPACMW